MRKSVSRLGLPSHVTCPESAVPGAIVRLDRKSTRLNSSHGYISYAVFCLKKKNQPPPPLIITPSPPPIPPFYNSHMLPPFVSRLTLCQPIMHFVIIFRLIFYIRISRACRAIVGRDDHECEVV